MDIMYLQQEWRVQVKITMQISNVLAVCDLVTTDVNVYIKRCVKPWRGVNPAMHPNKRGRGLFHIRGSVRSDEFMPCACCTSM